MIIKKLLFLLVFSTLIAPFTLAPGAGCMGCELRIINGKLVKISKKRVKRFKGCCFSRDKKGNIKAIKGTRAYKKFGKKSLKLKRGKVVPVKKVSKKNKKTRKRPGRK